MANPAPTINQINAFNATQGTTIDFNIIGGTELVRSNKIYIYDLSDNSLICTHLYVSTESIHELPANTDSSIVYESGKSSADFVNGAQYYAQIQTFTDTAGTQGGSGLSVAKMFWCLVNPTLAITTIPSTISTTSYNVSATYTDTSASVVSNIIQQYQFNLYSVVGSLLQSSGVVVGSGTQQGTSDVYDISYNFTGLNVGSSYYVTVEVTTTQGMNVIAQSGTFTVSIDTPTLGEATVVNNACDGYISVTSNLSGEYGGSASGEIASFVTDSVNNISSLKVPLEPIQDLHGYDAPWVGGSGKNKCPYFTSTTHRGVTFTVNSDGSVTANGTATGGDASVEIVLDTANIYGNMYFNGAYGGSPSTYNAYMFDSTAASRPKKWNGTSNSDNGYQNLTEVKIVQGHTTRFALRVMNGQTVNNVKFYPMICLPTETSPTYEPYSNICPISGHTEVDVVRTGKNFLFPSTWSSGYSTQNGVTCTRNADNSYSFSGTASANTWFYINTYNANHLTGFPIPSGTYKVSCEGLTNGSSNGYRFQASLYKNGVMGSNAKAYDSTNETLTITDGYLTEAYIHVPSGKNMSGITLKPMIRLASVTDSTYEPFGNTYTTALGRTVYGGTLDLVSGGLSDEWTSQTLNGAGSVSDIAERTNSIRFWYYMGTSVPQTTDVNQYAIIADGLKTATTDPQLNDVIGVRTALAYPYSICCSYPKGLFSADATSIKNYLQSNPLQIVYKKRTPQTYQLTPQQIQTLIGQNNVWSEQQGEIELSYHIPITNLLVKRQDVDDVSGNWLTLYSQPITQASDMDFTFIDFLNQYGKTYKYALVPLLTQIQSGVEVEVEGGYTVSDEVQSVFDGVFIVDSTGSQKCKANVGYGNVDMNQVVGSITPIGAKYPIVITNSQNQYHNGSISGTIVPDDYYFNGNLSRIDMVDKRNELEQFLANKRAKIIKDWNGNIWLAMIMDNVNCTFNNSYGMGIVNFSTSWVEVGDPTNQQDLQATGLINVGGV